MTTPGGGQVVGPTWADSMSMANLNTAVQQNSSLVTSQQSTNQQRFWSTPARAASSTVKEVLQVTLASTRKLNKISFDVAAFPHDVMVEYFEAATKSWTPCLVADALSPVPITHRVTDSMPAVLPPISSVTGHLHPQHSFSGHWRHLDFNVRPMETASLRIILSRTTTGTPPVNSYGDEVDYSLAVQGLHLGYSVTSLAHVPYTQPNPNSASRGTFATTSDLFGSVVNFSVRVNEAKNVLQPPPTTQDALTSVWKSEPMPIPWAVVNFYVDARDGSGNAQVLDRFFVDPLYTGPTTNLYYSNDEPTSAFTAPSDPLPDRVAVVHNSSGVSADVLHSGASAPVGTIAFVDVDNRALDFNPSRPWWIGAKLNLKFRHGTQSSTNPIFDCGEFAISMTPFGFRFSTVHGDTLGINLDAFDPATPMAFTVGYDGTKVRVNVRVGLLDYSDTITLTVPLANAVSILRFGGYQQLAPQSGDFDLNCFSLKTDVALTDEVAFDFITTPDPYVLASEFMGVNDPKTNNALLRYSYKFWNSNYRSGMIGGAPDRYHDMSWTPVTRDYVLRSGFMYFPPTKGKYWKFEFCNLVPQVVEVYKPITKKVMTFPPGMWVASQPIDLTDSAKSQISPGVDNSLVVNSMSQSLDGGRTVYVGTGGNGKTFSNTTARVLTDSEVRQRIGGAYWAWNFLPLHPVSATPAFAQAGVHTYEVIDYDAQQKLAYFVGLRSIQAYRLDYISTDDTPQYVEMFHDTRNLNNSTNWYLSDQHRMTSGDAPYAELRSKELVSNRVLTAIQFAAQQSDPVQLLPDDDFTDRARAHWVTVGDAVMSNTPAASQVLGSSIRIDRSLPPLTWNAVTANTLWSSITSLNSSFDMVQQGSATQGSSGGVSSQAVTAPGGGRLYAAARATAPADLSSPLYVQLYDEKTGIVVSENSAVVHANKVSEWYTSYTIGDSQGAVPFRWQDFSSTVSTAAWTDTFVRPNATTLTSMDSGQLWSWPSDGSGNPMSLAISSNKAVVTTEGFMNTIDVNTPWGSLEFKVGTMGTTTVGEVMLALMSPLFLDDQGVVKNSAGASFSGVRGNVLTTNQAARAVVANDDIRIDILPTVYVPSAQKDNYFSAGWDPTYMPYSLMFYLNGTWVRTFSHDLGARPVMGIKGRLNQQFTSWSWQPKAYGALPGPVINGMPRVSNGAFLDSTTQTTWVDSRNRTWYAVGAWDTTTTVETTGRDDVRPALTAASNGAVFYTDTGAWDGTLSVYLRNIAGTFGLTDPAGRHGNILCLDFDNGVYLDYQGRIVKNGVIKGTLFNANTITNNAMITVQFISVYNLQPANRGGIDPAVYPRMLHCKVDGIAQGDFYSAEFQTWTGTKRGVAGDIYDPAAGTRPAGATYTLDTSFRTFNWAPDATNVALDSAAPTWNNVTANGTVTYQNTVSDRVLAAPQYRARVVQKGPSIDIWDMDALSMYADPVIWSFANDGGYNFSPAYDVRNNPNGVMLFPTNVPVTDANQKPGTSLVWRAVSYRAGTSISGLVIRPWYGGLLSGVTHRPGLVATGPNVMSFDHFGAIENDSRFQTWSLPIPRNWWYSFRIIQRSTAIRSGAITVPTASSSLLLSQSLITNLGG